MKIERVDDKTVRCFLSNEELEEYDIAYNDFVDRSDKAREIVQDIMEQAEEEVGYKPPKFAFDLQIMMLPDEGMVLTFSEKDPLDAKNSEQLAACLQEMKKVLLKAKENAKASDKQEENEQSETSAAVPDEGKAKGKDTQNLNRPEEAIFAFEKLGFVMEFATALPRNLRVNSALYEMDDLFYLYLKKGSASYERYSRICIQAMEFARLYSAEEDKVLHVMEHGQCLVAERALKKLRLDS